MQLNDKTAKGRVMETKKEEGLQLFCIKIHLSLSLTAKYVVCDGEDDHILAKIPDSLLEVAHVSINVMAANLEEAEKIAGQRWDSYMDDWADRAGAVAAPGRLQ